MPQTETAADTKLSLILAAGELFAERGLDGVSVRDIVGKAGATLSAVNYHFGSKSGLYLETIRYALERHINAEDAMTLLSEANPSSPQEAADVLYRLIRRFCRTYLAPDHPQWYERLINRAVVDASDDVSAAIAEVLRPTDDALHRLLLEHVPGLDPGSAGLWRMCLSGQIHYFLMARRVINRLLDRSEEEYDEEFIETAASHVARNMVVVLGLPSPTVQGPRPNELGGLQP
ncbi:MAG: CerR family C-terminal domain-containing protein [Planctomycetaceae bacterium]|nr:CerR family C-terminal domain-containing protein [Planctomycetaceae bacterium]